MTLTLNGEIYIARQEKVGVMSARLSSDKRADSLTISLENSMFVTHGENVSYPYLRRWLVPILEEKMLNLGSVICAPKDVPNIIRRFSAKKMKTILVTNNFPRMGRDWTFTTRGLAEADRASSYYVDQVSAPRNDFICTPMVYHRAGVTSIKRHTLWAADVTKRTLGQPSRPEFSGHVINITPQSNQYFRLMDQYGVATVHEDTIVQMARTRASLFPSDPHMFQVISKSS